MIVILKLILMFSFAAISLAAVLVLILAAATVGLGALLPFSSVSQDARLQAAPYRKRLLYLIIAALAVCLILAVIEIAFL